MVNLLIISCVLAISASAANAENYIFSLKDAIAFSAGNNNLIKAAGLYSDAARQELGIVESRYYPGLVFEETFNASDSPTQAFMMKLDEGRFSQNDFKISNLNNPGTQHDFRTALTLQQTIFDPSLAPLKLMAVKESRKQALRFDSVKEDTAFQVFRQSLEVQKAKARLRSIEQSIGDAQEHLRLAKVRSGNGVGLKSDELRARTHLAQVEQQQITAKNDLILARMHLADIMGLKEGDSVDIDEIASTLGPDIPPDELVRIAIENRTDLNQSQVELEKSDAAVQLSQSANLPSVGAFASYQLNAKDAPFSSDNDSWVVGFGLKWQLFDGFKRYRENDRAVANRSAAAELLENRVREIRYAVRESCLRREEMGKRLEVARHSMEDAEETVRLLKKRFENSLATMTDLLDAQTALQEVRAGLVESESNYTLAGGTVYYTAGIFIKEILK